MYSVWIVCCACVVGCMDCHFLGCVYKWIHTHWVVSYHRSILNGLYHTIDPYPLGCITPQIHTHWVVSYHRSILNGLYHTIDPYSLTEWYSNGITSLLVGLPHNPLTPQRYYHPSPKGRIRNHHKTRSRSRPRAESGENRQVLRNRRHVLYRVGE